MAGIAVWGMARTCGYAHELSDLLPPREVSRQYPGVRRGGVDRWYGQTMGARQLRRIPWYFERTPGWDRPVWCIALAWFYCHGDAGQYPHLGWDFGMIQDALSLRRHQVCPFPCASRTDGARVLCLPDIFQCRRQVLEGIRAELGYPLRLDQSSERGAESIDDSLDR